MNKVFHNKTFQIHSSTIERIFLMRVQRLITSSYDKTILLSSIRSKTTSCLINNKYQFIH